MGQWIDLGHLETTKPNFKKIDWCIPEKPKLEKGWFSSKQTNRNPMGRETLEGLRVFPKPAASRKINKRIISHHIVSWPETRGTWSPEPLGLSLGHLSEFSTLSIPHLKRGVWTICWCTQKCRFMEKGVRGRAQTAWVNSHCGTKKPRDFTHPFFHKSTLLSTSADSSDSPL